MKDNAFEIITHAVKLMTERKIGYDAALALAKEGVRATEPYAIAAAQAMADDARRNRVNQDVAKAVAQFSRESDPGRELVANVQSRLRGEDVERHGRAGRPVRPTAPTRTANAAAILFGRSGLKLRKGRRPRFVGGETYSPPADLLRNSRDDKPVKMGPCACSCAKSADKCQCC